MQQWLDLCHLSVSIQVSPISDMWTQRHATVKLISLLIEDDIGVCERMIWSLTVLLQHFANYPYDILLSVRNSYVIFTDYLVRKSSSNFLCDLLRNTNLKKKCLCMTFYTACMNLRTLPPSVLLYKQLSQIYHAIGLTMVSAIFSIQALYTTQILLWARYVVFAQTLISFCIEFHNYVIVFVRNNEGTCDNRRDRQKEPL